MQEILRKQRRRLFQLIQQCPTWFVVVIAVFFLSFLTIWFHDDLAIRSPRDLISRKVLKVLFENAESIAIVSAVVLYFKEAPDRKAQKHYDAWQVIDNAAAAGVSTSYARIKALQDLNEDSISLRGLDVPGADMEQIKLPEADLRGADLKRTNLKRANLNAANLSEANLKGSDLSETNLKKANLLGANLEEAKLWGADLEGVDLRDAWLERVNLVRANLKKADLEDAHLWGSALRGRQFKSEVHHCLIYQYRIPQKAFDNQVTSSVCH